MVVQVHAPPSPFWTVNLCAHPEDPAFIHSLYVSSVASRIQSAWYGKTYLPPLLEIELTPIWLSTSCLFFANRWFHFPGYITLPWFEANISVNPIHWKSYEAIDSSNHSIPLSPSKQGYRTVPPWSRRLCGRLEPNPGSLACEAVTLYTWAKSAHSFRVCSKILKTKCETVCIM